MLVGPAWSRWPWPSPWRSCRRHRDALADLSLIILCWRPAVGVAVGLLAVPVAVLAPGTYSQYRATSNGTFLIPVTVMAALFLLALGIERFRGRARQLGGDGDGHAHRTWA